MMDGGKHASRTIATSNKDDLTVYLMSHPGSTNWRITLCEWARFAGRHMALGVALGPTILQCTTAFAEQLGWEKLELAMRMRRTASS